MKDIHGRIARAGDNIIVFSEVNINGHDVVSQSGPFNIYEDKGSLFVSDSGDDLSEVFYFEIVTNI